MHESSELLVHDEPVPCPYLTDRVARMPLRHPLMRLTPEQFDQRLASGDRRTGPFLYRTQCPQCQACIPIRLPVRAFVANRSQRRALRRGDAAIEIRLREPVADERRVALYNKHGGERGLSVGHAPVNVEGYQEFLVASCCDSIEIDYTIDDVLIAVAIVDRGARAMSAVYCCFDPDYSRYSPGVYSVLTQLRLARQWGLDYLYLGLYIAESPHMSYKTRYQPHELLVDGKWTAYPARR